MAKVYKSLRSKISPKRQEVNEREARKMIGQIALQDLRQSINLTQEEVARVLCIKQSYVSNLEDQVDVYISTLSHVVRSLGGNLKLVAVFPDREVVIDRSESKDD